MKRLLIILTLFLSTNAFSQTLEERAAVRACDCVQKTKNLNDENYRKCLASSITDVMVKDKNSNDLQWMNTVGGIQGVLRKVDSIVSKNCVVYSKEKLDNLRKKFYGDSKIKFVNNSLIIGRMTSCEKNNTILSLKIMEWH